MENCPTCERPVDPMDTELQEKIAANLATDEAPAVDDSFADTELPPEDAEPEELSDLEELEALIAELEAQLEKGFNLWLADRIAKLKKFADGDNFDADGNRLDNKVPEREKVTFQLSPPEAVELDGWWEAPMGEFGKLPRSMVKEITNLGFRNELAFAKETLGLSRARSNGAFVIRNQRETANYFLTHTAEAAAKTGTTTRIIAMMGHALDQWRFMFPTFDFYGANEAKYKKEGVGHFALDPEVPFTEEEKEYYRWMGVVAQTAGFGPAIAGAKTWLYPLISNPKERQQAPYVNGKKSVGGIPVAEPNYHRIWWVINHPHWALPQAVMKFNSASFKYDLWRTMCYKANRIDYGYAAPIPGWVPREEIDDDLSDNMNARRDPNSAWDERHGENTAAWSKTKPLFCRGSELERDGTPKDYKRD